jgi:D-beta-D-heptose 7-phosphate kinase/D-beta-D-heptose 1-phosphate adenosyltransferase
MDATVIDRLAQARALVVGDVLLDRFVEGRVSRISPEAPVPVLKHGAERTLLGGAGNVAANLLSYGATVTLVGLTGADRAADELAQLCASFHRLRPRLVRDASRPTTVKTRLLSGWHQLLRLDAEETHGMAAAESAELLAVAVAALDDVQIVVLSDYAKGVLDPGTVKGLIEAARRAGVPVIVDPKKADAAIFAGAALLTPNVEEMAQFSGIRADSDAAAEAACRRVLDLVAIDAILVTRGAGGMTLVERNGATLHVPAETHRVFDVTGAGDTVIATLAAALAVGETRSDAVRLANAAAGIVVTKPGTATVHPRELRQALGVSKAASVVERSEAAEQVALWREQGLRVGFTNGCFDLLHRGHLYSLEQAARRVDRLVVGVNGDASAERLKGPGRPVQDLATRSAVLAALRFVDMVVPFEEDTPEALITALTPDLLFKGADYAESAVVGGDHVKANGGRVELLPLLPGHSTTGTIKRFRPDG